MWRLSLFIWLTGCAGLHRALDVRALEGTAHLVERRAHISAAPWPFTELEELRRVTTPRPVPPAIERLPIGARSLHTPGLIEEQLAFRSQVTLEGIESNYARLYVYRHGPLGERPVLLWVPGLGVSDLALTLLRPLLVDALSLGFDVVFFVPPYHLERSPIGLASGDGVLATDLADHLGVIRQGVADLRETARWLRRSNVTRLGVFAGSLGANLSLHAAGFEGDAASPAFEFLVAMIPLVDWSALVFERPEFEALRARLEGARQAKPLRAVYDALDLSALEPQLAPASISVIASEWDEVTPAGPRERWQRSWGLERVTLLERGHGTVLIGSALREAARRVLQQELARLSNAGQPRR